MQLRKMRMDLVIIFYREPETVFVPQMFVPENGRHVVLHCCPIYSKASSPSYGGSTFRARSRHFKRAEIGFY